MLEPGAMLAGHGVHYDGMMVGERHPASIQPIGAVIIVLKLEVVIEEDAVEDQQMMRLVTGNHAGRANCEFAVGKRSIWVTAQNPINSSAKNTAMTQLGIRAVIGAIATPARSAAGSSALRLRGSAIVKLRPYPVTGAYDGAAPKAQSLKQKAPNQTEKPSGRCQYPGGAYSRRILCSPAAECHRHQGIIRRHHGIVPLDASGLGHCAPIAAVAVGNQQETGSGDLCGYSH